MGLIFAGTFDHDLATSTLGAHFDSGSATTNETVIVRNGHTYSVKFALAVDCRRLFANGSAQNIPGSGQNVNFLCGTVYVSALPGAGKLQRWVQNGAGGTNVDAIGSDENGKAFVRDATGTNVLSTNVLSTAGWYWYAWWWDNTAGARHDKLWMRKLDGVDAGSYWIDSTALTRTASNMRRFTIGPVGATKGDNVGTFYMSIPPIWLTDQGSVNNAILTDEHDVKKAEVTGDGHLTQLTSSGGGAGVSTNWDETTSPQAGDTDYNYSSGVGAMKQYSTIQTAAAIGLTVAPLGLCVHGTGLSSAVGIGINAGFTISDGTNDSAIGGCECTTSKNPLGPAGFDVNPAGTAWTLADVDTLQIGAICPADASNPGRRFYNIWANFLVPLSAPAPPAPDVPVQVLGGKGPLLRPDYDHLAHLRSGETGEAIRTIRGLQESIERTTRQERELTPV